MVRAATFFTALVALVVNCNGDNILAIFHSQTHSNFLAYEPLVRELAVRGHHVTVISSFPRTRAEKLNFYTDIFVPRMVDTANQTGPLSNDITRCRHILGHKSVHQLIHSSKTFNLLLLEWPHHQCYLGFAHQHTSAPVIGLSAEPITTQLAHDLLGNTSPYSYVPAPSLAANYSDHMTFKQRGYNAYTLMAERARGITNDWEYAEVRTQFFGHLAPLPSIARLQERMSFAFFYNDVVLGYPRPLLPNMADVGGLHIEPLRNLSRSVKEFMDGAKQRGVVVVDLGPLPLDTIKQLQYVFANMQQLVVWKANDTVRSPSANVLVSMFSTLSDVLAHRNVRALISTGDLLNVQAAIYRGCPLVGVPLEPGHVATLHRAKQLGFAIQLDKENINSGSLQSALHTILTNTSYTKSARAAAELFRDQPTPILKKAVYWTEYVLRYHGAKHLQPVSRELPWYKYFLVDAMGLMALAAILAAMLLYKAVRWGDDYMFGVQDDGLVKQIGKKKQL